MLKLAQEQPIKPYSLARETFHRARARTRVSDSRIFVDEQVFIKRLGNKLKDLLEYAEHRLYYKSDPETSIAKMINNTKEYTEVEIRLSALEIIWNLLAEPYQPNYESDPIDIDEWLSKDVGPSESEIEGLIEGKLRQYGCDP